MKTHRVAVVGVGYSKVGRKTGLSEQELARQAFEAAITDAGMQPSDIDGVSVMGGGNSMELAYTLGMMPINWYSDCMAGPAFVQPACQAIAAVGSGYAHTVAAFRVISQMPSFGDRAQPSGPSRPAHGCRRPAVRRAVWSGRVRGHDRRVGDAAVHGQVRCDRRALRDQRGEPAVPRVAQR